LIVANFHIYPDLSNFTLIIHSISDYDSRTTNNTRSGHEGAKGS
jgi:hypothetical protein